MTKRTVIKDAVPWQLYAGVKQTRTLSIKETDRSAKDMTGYSFFCEIRDRGGGRLLCNVTVDETNIATGVVVLEVTKAQGEALGARKAVYDVLYQDDATPADTFLLFRGIVTIDKLATEVSVP